MAASLHRARREEEAAAIVQGGMEGAGGAGGTASDWELKGCGAGAAGWIAFNASPMAPKAGQGPKTHTKIAAYKRRGNPNGGANRQARDALRASQIHHGRSRSY